MRPDKKKVVDEIWDDERIASFLEKQPPAGESADYFALHTAYQSMREADFDRFLTLFCRAGRDVNATSVAGRSIKSVVSEHRHGGEFAELLTRHGATD